MGLSSTFLGLNTAYLGLLAANASLNTTGNNISNVETEGYSRQHTVQQAAKAIQTFSAYGCAGAGVDVLAIERYRNEFYDVKYWNNNANVGEYEKKEYYMKQIENYFIDDDTQDGFATIFNKMYDTIEDLMKDSGTAEVRSSFISAAANLAEYFNTNTKNLQDLQLDVNSEIKICVDRIDALAQELVTLNKQINVVEVNGGTANELRDQRALIIDELSQYVAVETAEYEVLDNNNGTDTGATRFIVKIAGGQTLVDGTAYNLLECVARTDENKVNQMDADGLFDIVWSNGNTFSLTNLSMGGQLRGLIDLRDGNNGEYFNGTAAASGTTQDSNGNTVTTVSISVTEDYLQDFNKTTLPANGQIRIGGLLMDYSSFSFDYVYDDATATGSYQYTFTLTQECDLTNYMSKEARVGYCVEYQGIPYYLAQMTEWVRDYAEAFNKIETQEGAIDNYGNKAENFMLADNIVDGTQYTFSDMTNELYEKITNKTESYSISSTQDSYYLLTAGNFAVAERCVKDGNFLATHTGNVDEESNYDVVEQMIDLKTNMSLMSFRGCSSGKFLQCVLADISLNANKANNFSTNYTTIASSIENQRLTVSGVDSDEEGVNLVKYQNAYSLACQMIQTLSEVYDRLILETGV